MKEITDMMMSDEEEARAELQQENLLESEERWYQQESERLMERTAGYGE